VEHPDWNSRLPQEQAIACSRMSVEFVLEGGKGTLGKGRLAVVSPDIDEKDADPPLAAPSVRKARGRIGRGSVYGSGHCAW